MHTERIYKKPNMIANTSAFKRVAAAAAWQLEVPLQQLLFIASKRQPHTKALIWAEQHVCLGLYDRKLRGKRLASLNLIRQFIRASSVGTYAHCYSYIETLTYFKWYGERMRNSSGKRRYSGTALIKLFIHELKSKLRFSWQLPGEKKCKLTKITATHSTVPGEGTGQYNKADWTITSSNRRAKTLVNDTNLWGRSVPMTTRLMEYMPIQLRAREAKASELHHAVCDATCSQILMCFRSYCLVKAWQYEKMHESDANIT